MAAARRESTLRGLFVLPKIIFQLYLPVCSFKGRLRLPSKVLGHFPKTDLRYWQQALFFNRASPATDRFADCKIKEVTTNVVCRI
jgi:hypothetical protein